MSIAIIGHGIVGKATHEAFPDSEVVVVDPAQNKNTTCDIMEKECEIVFICVPTPQCNDEYFRQHISDLKSAAYDGLICIRSTIDPLLLRFMEKETASYAYEICHVPEFLTERFWQDEPTSLVFGGNQAALAKFNRATATSHWRCIPTTYCSIETAALMKLTTNSFFATKVIFMNHMRSLCERIDVDWHEFINVLKTDERVGAEHCDVPGHDGHFGYGGKCFPKDIKALNQLMIDHDVANLLSQVRGCNMAVRNQTVNESS
jgi:UDPglucose 6-dehydrogenase